MCHILKSTSISLIASMKKKLANRLSFGEELKQHLVDRLILLSLERVFRETVVLHRCESILELSTELIT